MKEPHELIKERMIEIKEVLDSIEVCDENLIDINYLTELHNRYLSSYKLITKHLISAYSPIKYEKNKNEMLIEKIQYQEKRIEKLVHLKYLYYRRWRDNVKPYRTIFNEYHNRT